MVSEKALSRAKAGAALRTAQPFLLFLRMVFCAELVILLLVAISWIAWQKGIFMGFRGSVHFGAPQPIDADQMPMLRLVVNSIMAFAALAAITHLHLFPRAFVIGFASLSTVNYAMNSLASSTFEVPGLLWLALFWLLLLPASKMSQAMQAHPAVFLAHYGGGKIVRSSEVADAEEALDNAWGRVRGTAIKRTWIGGVVILLILVGSWFAL